MSAHKQAAGDLTAKLKQKAHELGFPLAGVTAACAPHRLPALQDWLESGYHGSMTYFETRLEAYADPNRVLDGCRSIVMLGMPYWSKDSERQSRLSGKRLAHPAGKIARYALGEADYHDVIHSKLKSLKDYLLTECGRAQVRGVVDTAPLLEREFAELAGLGWVGKNTLLLNRNYGSYFFLAALLTDLELATDAPTAATYCGSCTACLDQCPTNAFVAPFVLDARKCISYLTIEHRENVSEELASQFDGWTFGCDICQEVCPWNRKGTGFKDNPQSPIRSLSDPTKEQQVQADASSADLWQVDLLETLSLDEDGFRKRFRKTPMWRPRRRGMLRNALLIASQQPEHAAALSEPICRLLNDAEPLLRSTSGWALKELRIPEWRMRIRSRLEIETAPEVLEHLTALCESQPDP